VTTAIQNPEPANTRRWPRHQVELPIVVALNLELSQTEVPGLATEISRGGASFYAGVPLQPGDPMEIEFQTPNKLRVSGVVRNREGYCFGVEFLARDGEDSAPSPSSAEQAAKPDESSAYSAICGELGRAEDKLATLLQRKLDANVSPDDPEFKRYCVKLLRLRQLRKQIEELGKVPQRASRPETHG
jgi:PilZ domain